MRIVPREVLCKSALTKTGIPGYDYCLNPYTGCAHNCLYCYASFMCRFTGQAKQWGEFVDVKANFPEVLAKQLNNRRKKAEGRVMLGTVTDAYQPEEAHYKITQASLNILADYQLLEVHILTKSALVQRDIPVLRRMQRCEVGFTITTMDRDIARVFELGASPPHQRLGAARQIIGAGIPVWVFIAPLLPGLSDTEKALTGLLKTLHETGIKEILVDSLNPYPQALHRLKTAYHKYYPESLTHLEEYLHHPEIYRDKITGLLSQINRLVGSRAYLL